MREGRGWRLQLVGISSRKKERIGDETTPEQKLCCSRIWQVFNHIIRCKVPHNPSGGFHGDIAQPHVFHLELWRRHVDVGELLHAESSAMRISIL